MKAYQKLSSLVYVIDKPIGKSFGDIEFYDAVLTPIKGKILEPACGNGRIIVPLFNNGHDIEGFDASVDMLHHLKTHCDETNLPLPYWVDTMESFTSKTQYEAVILPAGSFMLLDSYEKAKSALKQFHSHMHPNAKLYIDYYLDDIIQVGDEERRSFKMNEDTTIYLTMKVKAFDAYENVYTAHHIYEQFDGADSKAKEKEIFPLKFYTHESMNTLIEMMGFKVQRIYQDYKENTPKHKASMFTIEAIKNE